MPARENQVDLRSHVDNGRPRPGQLRFRRQIPYSALCSSYKDLCRGVIRLNSDARHGPPSRRIWHFDNQTLQDDLLGGSHEETLVAGNLIQILRRRGNLILPCQAAIGHEAFVQDKDFIAGRHIRREGVGRECPGCRGIVGYLPHLPFGGVPVNTGIADDLKPIFVVEEIISVSS